MPRGWPDRDDLRIAGGGVLVHSADKKRSSKLVTDDNEVDLPRLWGTIQNDRWHR